MSSSQPDSTADRDLSEPLIAARGGRQINVNGLREPNLDLSYAVKDGQLQVSLKVPVSTGDASKMPFLQVTRDPEVMDKLLNQAQGTIVENYPGLRVGPVKTSLEAEGKYQVFSFKASVGADFDINGTNFAQLKNKIETQFDETRQDFYRERAINWAQAGGARVPHRKDPKDPKDVEDVYVVSDQASVDYLKFSDQRYNLQNPGGAQRGLDTSILQQIVNERRGSRSDAELQTPGIPLASAEAVQRAPNEDSGLRDPRTHSPGPFNPPPGQAHASRQFNELDPSFLPEGGPRLPPEVQKLAESMKLSGKYEAYDREQIGNIAAAAFNSAGGKFAPTEVVQVANGKFVAIGGDPQDPATPRTDPIDPRSAAATPAQQSLAQLNHTQPSLAATLINDVETQAQRPRSV